MSDGKELGRGDEVTWRSHGKTVRGEVKKKITGRTRAAGRVVAASPEEPQFAVESSATGRSAVHKAAALKKGSRGGR
ncbi:DUF2945 domain-containing protein [Streptomyces sp. NPDC048507]|uniref:DUF2945 domain-containing protein n=1 Tax=Streptomyces sp. NPDC048507 TaxID=3365560 RepID=UPI00371C875F